jgi:DNA repair protein RadA/Sms
MSVLFSGRNVVATPVHTTQRENHHPGATVREHFLRDILSTVAKVRTTFICRSCGSVHPKWMGKCPDCGTWDSLEESRVNASADRDAQQGLAAKFSFDPDEATLGASAFGADAPVAAPIGLIDETSPDAPGRKRIVTGVHELDRVLGGGLVPGSAILVGGDPGIGKSTLLLQAAASLASRNVRTLYVTSEESAEQVKLRAERLHLSSGPPPIEQSEMGGARGGSSLPQTIPGATAGLPGRAPSSTSSSSNIRDELWLLADTNLARIVEQARRARPAALVIDSVQMIYKGDLDASPGSVAQLRRCCTELVYLAKISGMAVILVGHVTKEGSLAGPRLLEHLVDAVLYFEGDRHHAHRVLRGVKNRFGTTLEIGLFEMGDSGLREVADGAGVAARAEKPQPGSVVCPTISGTRCLLVEMQALTATGFLGSAKRKASGVDGNRLAMLIAVLEQHAGLRLADRDVFASAVGGVRIAEPAADLALALAIAGAHLKRAASPTTAVVGEVGLGGEIRPVSRLEQRVREAARLGYTTVAVPHGAPIKQLQRDGVEILPLRTISDAIQRLL